MNFFGMKSYLIYVEIGIERFNFQSEDINYSLDTCLHITQADNKLVISVIGQRGLVLPGVSVVELFKPDDHFFRDITRYNLLQIFMRYGIELWNKNEPHLFRPTISYKFVERLDKVLLGYQQIILERAGIEGGARKILFE